MMMAMTPALAAGKALKKAVTELDEALERIKKLEEANHKLLDFLCSVGTGKQAIVPDFLFDLGVHACADWDFLWIAPHHPEYESCTCDCAKEFKDAR